MSLQVDRVFQQSLKWVMDHLECFDPGHPYVQDHTLRVKPFLELVFVVNPFLRMNLERQFPELHTIRHFIERTFESYDFPAFAHHDPAGLMVFALRNEFFNITGQPERCADGLLEVFLASRLHEVVERSRIPFRVMDLHYALDRATGQFDPVLYLPLYQKTILAKGRSLTQCNTNDLYSITHTLFYLADLGQVPLKQVLPAETHDLQRMLQDALAMMLRQDNLDLAGEFLMCLAFVEVLDTPITRFAWNLLSERQLSSGAMPAPTYSPEKAAQMQEDVQRYEFTQCYHTTLVMLGAAVMVYGKQVVA
ncbi:DUF6895 family protein [Deinococcus roseus]|uniref:DUF6895 domain-containing protein n=1 Tax=Deinococcus roseus TaxID=392414 RepID=A0ABQ2DGJ0_9DEIO|nr:hypothetical protein [Deinococcus roseus]GGJ54836.1 hypothetical protein GCM10008938_46120 [Deinococcus roseus]